MSATITYKSATLTTVDNTTKKLLTAGKYMEDDVTITDLTITGIPIYPVNIGYNFSSVGLTWIITAEETP